MKQIERLNKIRKFTAIVLCMLLVLGAVFALAACDKNKKGTEPEVDPYEKQYGTYALESWGVRNAKNYDQSWGGGGISSKYYMGEHIPAKLPEDDSSYNSDYLTNEEIQIVKSFALEFLEQAGTELIYVKEYIQFSGSSAFKSSYMYTSKPKPINGEISNCYIHLTDVLEGEGDMFFNGLNYAYGIYSFNGWGNPEGNYRAIKVESIRQQLPSGKEYEILLHYYIRIPKVQ